jgi:hypothetical protein
MGLRPDALPAFLWETTMKIFFIALLTIATLSAAVLVPPSVLEVAWDPPVPVIW